MKAELQLELLTLLKALSNIEFIEWKPRQKAIIPARMLADMLVNYGGKAVEKKVKAICPQFFEPAQKVETTTKPKTATKPRTTTLKAVSSAAETNDNVPEVFTVAVGPYSSKYTADADALQFQASNVFTYRTTLFPNPLNYGVSVTMVSITPKLQRNSVGVEQYMLELTMSVWGEAANEWIRACKARIETNGSFV